MLVPQSSLKHCTDEALFQLVKKDNAEAFEEIYARYWKVLVSFACRNLQSQQKAEDLVQEIFISFYRRRHSIDFTVSLRAYLARSLKFRMISEYRSQTVRRNYQQSAAYMYQHRSDGIPSFEHKELAYSISRSIDKLPEKCREVFLLSRTQELSYKAISGHLGISVSTVEKHIIKALKHIKENLHY